MELANARLRLNKVGSDVPIVGLTPAESLLLHVLHQANNGGSTFGEDFDKIKIIGEAKTGDKPRTNSEELARLKAKYGHCVTKKGDSIIGLVWPGLNPELPQKFSQLDWKTITFNGVEVAALNYITGQPAVATPPVK